MVATLSFERKHPSKLGVRDWRAESLGVGRTRQFTMQPHGYYDSAAEIVERKKDAIPTLYRSKTRCTTTAEWMEVGEVASEKALWRIESRYGDRSVYWFDPTASRGDSFISVLRMYRGDELMPQLLLVHRSDSPEGFVGSGAGKEVEVYLCSDISDSTPEGELHKYMDPDTELDTSYESRSVPRSWLIRRSGRRLSRPLAARCHACASVPSPIV